MLHSIRAPACRCSSGVLFGLIPVLKYLPCQAREWRRRFAGRSAGTRFSQGRERHRARNTLVVVQIALALVLLISSGLMIRTFQHLRNVHAGFTHPEEIQILHAFPPPSMDDEPERVMRMWQDVEGKLEAIPGVTSVALAGSRFPLEALL